MKISWNSIIRAMRPFAITSLAFFLALSASVNAGNLFITGHDPDFHAFLGGNAGGAQNIINRGLTFVRNGNSNPILYIQSSTANSALGDHTDSEQGLIASGYTAGNTPGNHYVKVDSTAFSTAVLSNYSALLVPSDHGGTLTGDDLAALNARAGDIVAYVNAGAGLMALAEDGFRTPASSNPQPTNFGFVPFIVSEAALSQSESGFTVTPFGASLGLSNSDINGNASHNIFTSYAGFTVVDLDAAGNVITIAYSGTIPEPSTAALWILATTFGLCRRNLCRRKTG
jgi:hypothetical protein